VYTYGTLKHFLYTYIVSTMSLSINNCSYIL